MKKLSVHWTSCLIVVACTFNSATADTLRTVALSSEVAPGTSNEFFFSLSFPILNSAGQTAFQSGLFGAGVPGIDNAGIWSEGGGNGLELVARIGDVAPGTSGARFLASSDLPILNSAGQTAFRGRLVGTGVSSSNNAGIWSEGGGNGLVLVARTGDAAPGTSGALFSFLGDPLLNGAGQTAFKGNLTGAGVSISNDSGIWSEAGGNGLKLVAREGDAAPGTSGALFSAFILSPAFNSAGQTAFHSSLTGTGVTDSNNAGIWSEGAGSGLALIARAGDAAPDTSGAVFSTLGIPVINSAGQTAFSGTLTGTGISESNNGGVWSEGGGSGLELVAREGDAAPGTSGALFSGFRDVVLNDAGQTGFTGSVTGSGVSSSNNRGIWSEGGGNGLKLVAREGDAAPGTSGAFFSSFRSPIFNRAGQTAFLAELTGTGVTFGNDTGIWAEDTAGNLRLIARTGDLLDVDDGPGTDLRTISSLSFFENTGNEDGRRSGFNDLGQLAFGARFTDNIINNSSGIFVSNLVAVPEPSSLVLLSLAALGACTRRSK